MLLPWSREHHRHELLATPFPDIWRTYLNANVVFYTHLTLPEREKLEHDLRLLIAEKHWEGVSGLGITAEIQVTVAAQAVRLVLNRTVDDFAPIESIVIYPDAYLVPQQERTGALITETARATLGTAAAWGTVVLSWSDALAAGRNQTGGRNVVLHEFAHQLDMRDGNADGVPPLDNDTQIEEWSAVMSSEYQALTTAIEQGRHTLIDSYAATNAAEFFAVVTEYFFGQPSALLQNHLQLYNMLRGYYHQDPLQGDQQK